LCNVRHESLEVRFNIPVFEHYLVKICPHYLLCFCVFGLHVANYNVHDFAISWIINMTSQCCPTSNSLYMVKNDPWVLHIALGLHSCNKTNSTPNPVRGHLEDKNLITKYLA
jgi:hypothetical protein